MKHVAKLETERTQEIDLLKAELAKLREKNQEAATTIDEHNLVLKNLNDNFKKQQAERDKQFSVEMNTKLYERNNDIAELKAAVAIAGSNSISVAFCLINHNWYSQLVFEF